MESRTFLDIMHYHIDTPTPRQKRWALVKEHYKGVMRDPQHINFVTILREPRDRLLSYYTFFVEFKTLVSYHEGQGRKLVVLCVQHRVSDIV